MRKPESSKKRRLAAAKRALKRSKRNTNDFKKNHTDKKLLEKHRNKIAAEKKFRQHLNDLMGKQQ